jgi:hypothetical protein
LFHGWDEETMLLVATRFIAELGDEDVTVLGRFKAYLKDQVAEENYRPELVRKIQEDNDEPEDDIP